MLYRNLCFKQYYDNFVTFEDLEVTRICLENWDTNHDGKLSMNEVLSITNFGTTFNGSTIQSFDDLYMFNPSVLQRGIFNDCKNLQSVTLSYTNNPVFYDNVSSYKRIKLKGEWPNIPQTFIWSPQVHNKLEAFILESLTPPDITYFIGLFMGRNVANNTKIYVPDKSIELYKHADTWKDYKQYIFPISEYNGI